MEQGHAWANHYSKLRWCTERRQVVVESWLLLAFTLIVIGRLIPRLDQLPLGRPPSPDVGGLA